MRAWEVLSEYICPKNKLNVVSSTFVNWLRKQHHFIKLINLERKTRLVAFNCRFGHSSKHNSIRIPVTYHGLEISCPSRRFIDQNFRLRWWFGNAIWILPNGKKLLPFWELNIMGIEYYGDIIFISNRQNMTIVLLPAKGF